MTDSFDHVLPNGFTFLASTAGSPGSWAKATDPVTAARNACKYNGSRYPEFVQIWYGPDCDINVTDFGGISWKHSTANAVVPIGFFKMTQSTMKPSQDERMTHEDFMDENQRQFKKSSEYYLEQMVGNAA